MRLTKASLANPAAMAIIASVVVMLGALSLSNIPAQLLPQIEKPIVTVMTAWPGASPREVESELTVPVEEVLQGTPGMTELMSQAIQPADDLDQRAGHVGLERELELHEPEILRAPRHEFRHPRRALQDLLDGHRQLGLDLPRRRTRPRRHHRDDRFFDLR